MTELLSMEEIKDRYRDKWVLLVDIKSDPGPVLRRARVVWHGHDRAEGWRRAKDVDLGLFGVLYMGDFDAYVEPILML